MKHVNGHGRDELIDGTGQHDTDDREREEHERREASLRRQHRAWLRDGHNRHGGIVTAACLANRRRRRLMRQSMRSWVGSYRRAAWAQVMEIAASRPDGALDAEPKLAA